MNRIIKIPGRTADARQQRLQRVQAWMGARGWELADYAEEAGSALFERPPAADRLPWRDSTRWLPGPGALRPAEWIFTVRADPRLVAVPGLLVGLTALLTLALFGPSSFDVEAVQRELDAQNWRIVTADQLNVRGGPGTQHPVAGVLYRDQRVLIEAEVDSVWVRLSIPVKGYVSREYLAAAPPPAEDP